MASPSAKKVVLMLAAGAAAPAAGAVQGSLQASVTQSWAKEVPTGCLFRNAKYERADLKSVENPTHVIRTPLECQELCQKSEGCKVFGYFASAQSCYLSHEGGFLEPFPGAVSGPAHCKELPSSCSALPSALFPGATIEESQRAWPSGGTPTRLQCWPWNEFNQPGFCFEEKVTVLETKDTAGRCLGLTKVTPPAGESCEVNCAKNVMCPAWQEVVKPAANGEGNTIECWQGLGTDCFAERGLVHQNAGRFMHGHYRVLKDLKGIQVMELTRVFNTTKNSFANEEVAITHCKNMCLSLLSCQAWQFSSERGCWIEDPSVKAIPYPPTTASFRKDTPFAQTAVAGEYIQRMCGQGGFVNPVPNPNPAADTTLGPLEVIIETTTPAPETTQPTTIATTVATTTPATTTTQATTVTTKAKIAWNGRFITAGEEVFWQDPFSGARHVVPPALNCDHCQCRGVLTYVEESYVQGLKDGNSFDCSMMPPSPVPVEGRFISAHVSREPLYWQENDGLLHPVASASACSECGCKTEVVLVDPKYLQVLPSSTVFSCDMVQAAHWQNHTFSAVRDILTDRTTATESGSNGASLPWWGVTLLIGGICGCIMLSCFLYVFLCVSPENRKRAIRLRSLEPLTEDGPCSGEAEESDLEVRGQE